MSDPKARTFGVGSLVESSNPRTPKMSLQLDTQLQNTLDISVAQSSELSRTKWIKRVIECVLKIKPQLTKGVLSEMEALFHIMNSIPWQRFETLYKRLKDDPLSYKISKIDLFTALVVEGLYSLEKVHHNDQQGAQNARTRQQAHQRRYR